MDRPAKSLVNVVCDLCRLTWETEWVEFKVNIRKPEEVREYTSALANSAALVGKAFAYVVWGISDRDHTVVGTEFDANATKIGNESLECWLLRLLEPKLHFRFFQVSIEGHSVIVLEIERVFRPTGAISRTRARPCGLLQEEAEGLPRKGAGVVARFQSNVL